MRRTTIINNVLYFMSLCIINLLLNINNYFYIALKYFYWTIIKYVLSFVFLIKKTT